MQSRKIITAIGTSSQTQQEIKIGVNSVESKNDYKIPQGSWNILNL